MHVHVLDAARRYDPTGTTDIRSRFRVDMARRWLMLRQMISRAIIDDDVLGLGALSPVTITRSVDPVHEFQTWIDQAMLRIVSSGDGSWTQDYLNEAAARARSRAMRLVPAMGPPKHENAQMVVGPLAAVELQGVVEAVSQRAVRAVAEGMLRKHPARKIAAAVNQQVLAVGKVRSEALVEMSVNAAFNHATLDTFKGLGFKRVGIEPEWLPPGSRIARVRDADRDEPPGPNVQAEIEAGEERIEGLEVVEVLTAGDDLVCEECEDISEGGPYDVDEARGLIPAHVNCRCAFVPFFDERFASVRE